MSGPQLIDKADPKLHPKYVQTTGPAFSGYFAVIVWWNPSMGGFWEPWDKGVGRYETEREAYAEALELGETEALPVLRRKDLEPASEEGSAA